MQPVSRDRYPSSAVTTSSASTRADHGPIIAVIPAYNEELAIGTVVLETRMHVDRTIVVDDGSRDRTAEVATLAGADVIRLSENQGKAYAMMKGFARARGYNPAVVVMLDGDGQHNPAEIPKVVAPVLQHDTDLVIGSRYIGGGNSIPVYRKIGQKTLDFATSMSSVFGGDSNGKGKETRSAQGSKGNGNSFRTSDSQSGFRAISGMALEHMDFYSEGYNIETDMLTHFSDRGLSITEVPISVRYGVANGHKKHPVSHGLGILVHIIGLIGYRRPLISFGIPGVAIVVAGLISGSLAFADYYATSKFSYLLLMGSALLLILGLLLVTTALVLNSLSALVQTERGRS